MSGVIKISEAASIALHTMAYLSAKKESAPVSTKEIAKAHGVSEAHLSKVVQRLAHSGLVKTVRGPGGGVKLAKPPEKITLLEVYESLEGSLGESKCLLGAEKCINKTCILGDLVFSLNKQAKTRLAGAKLSDFAAK